MLLKRTAVQQLYIKHAYRMCSFQLQCTTLKLLLQSDGAVCCRSQVVSFLQLVPCSTNFCFYMILIEPLL